MGTSLGGLHQLEYRWLRNKDMYPVAWSEELRPMIEAWYGRLAGLVRPDPPGPDAPASSFVYTTFSDGTSAAIWRSWDQQAIPLGGGDSDRQSLVARVLVGDVTTLPPVTALALGFVGWPGITGPEPGQVQPDDRLPVIAVDELPVLIAQAGAGLEAAADRLQGLEFLLAQALRDSATPLSVLLPKRLVTHPLHSGLQAPMLWALLHTVRPLLDGQDDPEAATRAWTFSTYEPPLGRSDTRWLANIVFRADQQARPPQITRNEITIRPWDPGQHPPSDQPAQIARLLQAAYRQIGAEPVAQFLADLAATYPDRTDRLAVAQQRLAAMVNEPDRPGDRSPSAATTVPPRRVAPISSAPGPDSAFDGRGAVDPGFERPAYAEAGQAYAAAAYQDRIRHEAAYHEYEEDPLAAGTSGGTDPDLPDQLAWAKAMRSAAATAGSAGRPGADGVPVPAPPEHRDPRDQEGRPRTGVLNLLHRLTQNPEESAFREAVAMLRHGDGPLPDPEARAEARYVLPRRGWYVPVLVRHDPQCVDPALTTLFTLTVIPDLRVQGVADDVARWAGECEAPPAVIRALATAAARQGPDCSRLLEDVLRRALSRRWLSEHGIGDKITSAEAGAGARLPGHRRPPAATETGPRWQLFATDPEGRVIASPLPWLCLLQVVLIVLVVLRL